MSQVSAVFLYLEMVHHFCGDGVGSPEDDFVDAPVGQDGEDALVEVHDGVVGSLVPVHHRVRV